MPPLQVQPIPPGLQMLLQRLMAAHVMDDETAKQVFQDLMAQPVDEEEEDPTSMMGQGVTNLQEAFMRINRQLKPAFGLEIVTMVDGTGNTSTKTTTKTAAATKYHAVINTQCDEAAKSHSFIKAYTPHERAFLRLLMQRLVEEEHLKRKDCINLRSSLENGFKLNLEDAERMVQVLLDEEWLQVSHYPDDDEEENRVKEEEEDEDDEEGGSSQRRAKKKPRRRHRRESVQNQLELAPRSYMELSHFLSNVGLDPQDMPQFLYHRE